MAEKRQGKNAMLNEKQAKFVETFSRTGNISEAERVAGYSSKSCRGHKLLKKSPAVKAAIEGARKQVIEQTGYNLTSAMKEADDAIEFSKQTKNANAYVKACELKAKLNGLLVEKHDHRVANFQLNIGGIDDDLPSIPTSTVQIEEDEEEDLIG